MSQTYVVTCAVSVLRCVGFGHFLPDKISCLYEMYVRIKGPWLKGLNCSPRCQCRMLSYCAIVKKGDC